MSSIHEHPKSGDAFLRLVTTSKELTNYVRVNTVFRFPHSDRSYVFYGEGLYEMHTELGGRSLFECVFYEA
jgi:hypothetical protein